jgi:hypothetical protein
MFEERNWEKGDLGKEKLAAELLFHSIQKNHISKANFKAKMRKVQGRNQPA